MASEVTTLAMVGVGAVLALLVAAACWALYAGLAARRRANALIAEKARLEALLAAAPALPMTVQPDRRLELPERIADWLGLSPMPRYLDDLTAPGAGLTAADLAGLIDDVGTSQKAGRGFTRSIVAQGSSRVLTFRGARAAGSASVIVWVFDDTDARGAIAQLADERDQLHNAFDALTGLIEAAPLPMWYRGPDLRLQMVNTAYVAAVEGASAEDVVLRGLELVEASSVGGPLVGAVRARDRDEPQMQALPATVNGARRMLRVYDVPLPIGGVAGFAIDIDELEQARAAIKRFGEAQRAMLDRLSAGVAQFAADRSLSFCNQPFRRMFAMRSEWLADRPEFDRVLERMREAGRLPEARDFPGWKAERRDWFYATDAQEERWHLPGGVHLRVVAQPLPDGGLLLIFEDRTEQVQLASARDTLLRVRTATFDNLFEGLGVFAADGRLQLWNNRFRTIWGMEEEFLAGHPRIDGFAERGAPLLANPGQAVLIRELVRSATVERQQRGGRARFADGRFFDIAAVPLPDGNALFTMLDVSDSRRIEQALRDRNEALEKADRVKTDFVAAMSYELRTPLTSIAGFAEMLEHGFAGELTGQAQDYVGAILESTARLGALIDDVLDLTQNEGAPPPIARAMTELAAVARAAGEAVAAAATRKGIDFALEIAPSFGSAAADARRLQQAIEHLLRHAVAGTPAGGRVLLHADGTAELARLVVSDNGPGMTPEEVKRAFDRFSQTGVAPSGERALGLDLPLAKQFVEAHGGTIALVSEPGAGTLITVELPR